MFPSQGLTWSVHKTPGVFLTCYPRLSGLKSVHRDILSFRTLQVPPPPFWKYVPQGLLSVPQGLTMHSFGSLILLETTPGFGILPAVDNQSWQLCLTIMDNYAWELWKIMDNYASELWTIMDNYAWSESGETNKQSIREQLFHVNKQKQSNQWTNGQWIVLYVNQQPINQPAHTSNKTIKQTV